MSTTPFGPYESRFVSPLDESAKEQLRSYLEATLPHKPSAAMSGADAGIGNNIVPMTEHTELPPIHRIYDPQAIESAFAQRLARADGEDATRLTRLFESVRARGEFRKLARVPAKWRWSVHRLAQQFPNFAEVTDFLCAMFALAEHANGVPEIPPLLFNGPPGTGKSLFARALSELLGAGMVEVHMETAQCTSTLTGSAEHWSNTKPGAVCTALLERDYANMVFFGDEVDKAVDHERDPLSSFLLLLDPVASRAFTDQSCPWMTMDASRLVWVCTANDADRLPAPLLDRFRVFDIEEPSDAQVSSMVREMFKSLVATLPPPASDIRLTAGAVERLCAFSLRQARMVLREVVGAALYRGRKRIRDADIPLPLGDEEQMPSPPIGFIH